MLHLSLLDFDGIYAGDPDAKVLAKTDTLLSDQDYLRQQLFSDDVTDLNFVSSCSCGNLTGNFYEGTVCPTCKTVVRTNFADELKFRAWLEIPDVMPPILHPVAYMVLEKWIGKNLLNDLLDVDAELPASIRQTLGTGFHYFYENFDDIIRFFATNKTVMTPARRKRTADILEFIKYYRPIIFVRHMPVLNQSLHVITHTGTMTYSDTAASHILNAFTALSGAVYSFQNSPRPLVYVDQHLKKMYEEYLHYTDNIINTKLVHKEGLIRKYILGTRIHNSFRAVIVPITTEHSVDDLHIPWKIAVVGLKLEILNVLTHPDRQYKMSMPEALALHAKAIGTFDPIIHEVIKTLKKECPYKGFPVLFGRNPGLRHGAVQLRYATHVKIEIEDNTLGLSASALSALNAIQLAAMRVIAYAQTLLTAGTPKDSMLQW